MKFRKYKTVALSALVLMGSLCAAPKAQADITITPTRIVFEDRDRFKEVALVNTGKEEKTYAIGWRFFKMVEADPVYEPVDASVTDFDLTKYIVHTPRRVTLAPGASQRVRLALRRPPEVPAGEYRAHLEFASVAEAPKPPTPEEIASGKADKQVAVKINVGYTIPVVFDAGEPDVSATIDSFSLERNAVNGGLMARIVATRHGGPYGVLGHLYVYNGNKLIGEISNAHIFPEVNKRTYVVPLTTEDFSGSDIRVVMGHYDKSSLKTYGERTFPVK